MNANEILKQKRQEGLTTIFSNHVWKRETAMIFLPFKVSSALFFHSEISNL